MPVQPGTRAASVDRTVSYHLLKAASRSGAMVALTTNIAGRGIAGSFRRAGRGDSAEALETNGADLVLGDLGNRVRGRVRQEVGGRVGQLDERDEDGARAYGLGHVCVPGQLTAPRLHPQPPA